IENIRSFIRNELGVYADKGVAGIPSFAVSENFVAAGGLVGRSDANIGGMGNLADFIRGSGMFNAQLSSDDYLKKVFRSDAILADIDAYSEQQTSGSGKDVFFTANGPACKFASPASLTVSWDRIRATCLADKKLGTYLARLKELHAANSSILNTDGEEEAILECAQPLMQDLLSATLIHEIGHNLGLGHNFAGTSDTEDNFAKNDDGSIAFASSSVMDYMDRPSYFNTKVGPYDVAAIRFLYSRKVETKDGQFVDVPKNSSILSAVANQGKTLKPYRMCTDQEVPPSTGLPLYDPMCGRGEMGSTPEKYVKWVISKIHADLIQNGYRYNDKAFVGPSVGYLDRLKQVQEYFRYLIRGSAGAYLENLTGSTPAEKKAALEAMIAATPEADRALVESYYKAVNLIFDFGREFMALPTRVCLIQDNAGIIVDALEFAPLRQRIFDKSRVTVQNCKQAYGYAAAALTSMGKTYVADLGNVKFLDRGLEINGLELDLDPASAANKLKQIAFGSRGVDLDPSYSSGSIRLKNKVIEMLTSRKSVLKLAADSGVGGSNFLDYEWFAAALYSDAWQNLLSGTKGELLDATLLAGKTFQLYEDTVNLAPFYLFTLYSNGLNTRSRSYSYALAMRPRKERSLSIFSQGPGATENPIWYVTNTANEVLYADTGIAKSIIQLFVRMEQFQKSKAIHDATHAADTAEILNTLTASVTSLDAALAVDEK
ncbi:MAG: zinc-dependent metalloprotease, partial [Pseudobdellovibrionaceae bacterium]|nr:zinc-dependent metalloprotease [Pseudobdellovibrionaceae bacterium]